jgi:hypothetical protein
MIFYKINDLIDLINDLENRTNVDKTPLSYMESDIKLFQKSINGPLSSISSRDL